MAVPGKRIGPPSPMQLRAFHEAGHAVAALLKGFSLTRVSISRRGRVGGACEYRFRIPRAGSPSAARRLARAGAAVALAGSVAQDAQAAERGWVAVDLATGAPFRPFAPGAEDDVRVAKRFARRVYRSPEAQRAFFARMRSSTEHLLQRPEAWAAVHALARTLLQARTLCGEHATERVVRAMVAAAVRLPPRSGRPPARSASRKARAASRGGARPPSPGRT
jgi:hypothetical protein